MYMRNQRLCDVDSRVWSVHDFEDMWEIISKYNFRVLIFQGTTSRDDVMGWVLQQIQKLDAYEKPKASQCGLKDVVLTTLKIGRYVRDYK